MSIFIRQILNFIRLLHSDTATGPLAWGLSLGCVLGFSPFFSLQTLLVLLVCFVFRVQLGAAFLSAFFFKFVAYLIDPLADPLGRWVLENPHYRPLFVTLYNMPIVPFTRFNNSIVMGSGLIGFALAIPLFFVFKFLIQKYRMTVAQKLKSNKLWIFWQGTTIYKLYRKYQELYN